MSCGISGAGPLPACWPGGAPAGAGVACVVAGAPAFGAAAAGFAAGFAGGFAAGAGAVGAAGCCASATPIAPADKTVTATAKAALRVVVRRAHTFAFFIGNLTLWPPHGLVKSRSKPQSIEADAMPENRAS